MTHHFIYSVILFQRAQSSLQRTRQLNPMVSVSYDTADVADKKKEFFKQFDVVCATGCSKQQLLRISKICHEEKIKFFAGDVHGYYGVCFADLQEHVYVEYVGHCHVVMKLRLMRQTRKYKILVFCGLFIC